MIDSNEDTTRTVPDEVQQEVVAALADATARLRSIADRFGIEVRKPPKLNVD